MKKVIIITTCSFTTLIALVLVFTFAVPHKRTTASGSSAAYASDATATAEQAASEIVIQPYEMAASKIKETLLADLQAVTTNEPFFLEYHACSPKLLACLFMATKDHATARQILQNNKLMKLSPQQLQALRDHEATRAAMVELEVMEGQKMGTAAPKLVEIVNGLDVTPAESDVDEQVREIALTLKHIAIIADGNRRWAKREGLHPFEGHKKGFVDISPKLFQESWRLGIHTLTLWCCSTNNLERRDPAEVKNFLSCFDTMIKETIPLAKKHKVRIIHLGRKDRIPEYNILVIFTW